MQRPCKKQEKIPTPIILITGPLILTSPIKKPPNLQNLHTFQPGPILPTPILLHNLPILLPFILQPAPTPLNYKNP